MYLKISDFIIICSLVILGVIFWPSKSHEYKYIRKYVGSKIINIEDGTGFYIKGQSGKSYILSNYHVCGDPHDKVIEINFEKHTVLKIDETNDLCLIGPLKEDKNGIDFANGFKLYDEAIMVTLYKKAAIPPKLEKETIRIEKGEIIGVGTEVCEFDCPEEDWFTTINTYGGDSGSPVINSDLKLIGIMTSADINNNYGFFVPIKFIKEFVKGY